MWSWDTGCVCCVKGAVWLQHLSHNAHSLCPSSTWPRPAQPLLNTICYIHGLVLTMGIMMPEPCWDKRLIINIKLVESCWFLSPLYPKDIFFPPWKSPWKLPYILRSEGQIVINSAKIPCQLWGASDLLCHLRRLWRWHLIERNTTCKLHAWLSSCTWPGTTHSSNTNPLAHVWRITIASHHKNCCFREFF